MQMWWAMVDSQQAITLLKKSVFRGCFQNGPGLPQAGGHAPSSRTTHPPVEVPHEGHSTASFSPQYPMQYEVPEPWRAAHFPGPQRAVMVVLTGFAAANASAEASVRARMCKEYIVGRVHSRTTQVGLQGGLRCPTTSRSRIPYITCGQIGDVRLTPKECIGLGLREKIGTTERSVWETSGTRTSLYFWANSGSARSTLVYRAKFLGHRPLAVRAKWVRFPSGVDGLYRTSQGLVACTSDKILGSQNANLREEGGLFSPLAFGIVREIIFPDSAADSACFNTQARLTVELDNVETVLHSVFRMPQGYVGFRYIIFALASNAIMYLLLSPRGCVNGDTLTLKPVGWWVRLATLWRKFLQSGKSRHCRLRDT
ncbi:hypothetical protein C8R44DRAFT_752347 [Mycena epipterygia]|nr:hypothetical protein C8R44DRAFT_752347 [Mycena epipterygia]